MCPSFVYRDALTWSIHSRSVFLPVSLAHLPPCATSFLKGSFFSTFVTDPKTLCCRLTEVILVCFNVSPKFYIYTIVPIILLYFLPVLVYNSANFAYPEVLRVYSWYKAMGFTMTYLFKCTVYFDHIHHPSPFPDPFPHSHVCTHSNNNNKF